MKLAIVMHALGVSREEAERRLESAGGVIRRVVPDAPPPGGADEPADEARRGGVCVGLMSGTSLDGISAAVVRFTPDGEPLPRASCSRSTCTSTRRRSASGCSAAMQRRVRRASTAASPWTSAAGSPTRRCRCSPRRASRAPTCARSASHGQTLWHEPGHSTWQIDAPAVIAERTGIAVVSDFRVRDVAAGGQGAPLVPIADALLFAGDGWRALQNIGGIGNVTVVPPDGTLASVRAFDTGPGSRRDRRRRAAHRPRRSATTRTAASRRAGTPMEAVVDELLAHPYFAAEPPKSTGRELFDDAYVDAAHRAVPAATTAGATDADVVATAVSLTARSIADAYRRFMPEPVTEVLLSGGGAKNPVLFDADRTRARAAEGVVVRRAVLRWRGEGSRRVRAARAAASGVAAGQRADSDRARGVRACSAR